MSSDRVTAEQRRLVIERAKGCCEYCVSQMDFATQSFSVEHIMPRARGGSSDVGNLALACQGCNNHKFTKTEGLDPLTEQTVPLFHPRTQRWRDHFAWNDDYTIVIGLTPTGRATVNELYLNRSGVINITRITGQLAVLSLLTLLIWSLESLTEYLYSRLWRNLAQTLQHELRVDAYSHLQELELSYFEERSTGMLLSVLNADRHSYR